MYLYTTSLLKVSLDFNKINCMWFILHCFRFVFIPLTYMLYLYKKGHLCHFRTQAELDRYLEASQIRERAIERINNVIGTYGPIVCTLYFFWDLLSVISLFGI